MSEKDKIILPKPIYKGKLTIEEVLMKRKTIRGFKEEELDEKTISQLLWALQGITNIEDKEGKKIYHRAAPSAGKSYSLIAFIAFKKGFFEYNPIKHELLKIGDKDIRENIASIANVEYNKEAIIKTPLTLILVADGNKRPTPIWETAVKFIYLEAGHATQNLLLQLAALGLGSITITSFNIQKFYDVTGLGFDKKPIYLLPIGIPK